MSRESSTNARFEDNGDIGHCDTEFNVTTLSDKMSYVSSAAGRSTTLIQSNFENLASGSSHVESFPVPVAEAVPSAAKVLATSTSEVSVGETVENEPKSSLLLPFDRAQRSSYESIPQAVAAAESVSQSRGRQQAPLVADPASKECIEWPSRPQAVEGARGCVLTTTNSGEESYSCSTPLDYDKVAAAAMTTTRLSDKTEKKDDDASDHGAAAASSAFQRISEEKGVEANLDQKHTNITFPTVIICSDISSSQINNNHQSDEVKPHVAIASAAAAAAVEQPSSAFKPNLSSEKMEAVETPSSSSFPAKAAVVAEVATSQEVQERPSPSNAIRSSGLRSTSKQPSVSQNCVGAFDSIPMNSASSSSEEGDCITKQPEEPGAKHSLSKNDCHLKKRGSGWGKPLGLGLRGGGESAIANGGTTGWGPPPNNAGSSRGWGSVPPPNPSASAAWGAAPSAPAPAISNDESNGSNAATKNSGNLTPPTSSTMAAPPPAAPQQTSTSWAAAAGKGLPTNNESTNNASAPTSSTSKQALESLQSVREALFSQDGWGGSNVKQDNAWDIGGGPSNNDSSAAPKKEAGAAAPGSTGAAPAASGNMGPPRNDGTDLWKSTLSGQPPAPKPQPSNNPWGHTPQNPTDYRQWGEEDGDNHGTGSGGGGGGGGPVGSAAPGSNPSGFGNSSSNAFGGNPSGPGRDGSFWSDQQNGPQYGAPQKPKDDWSNAPVGGASNWGGPGRDNDMNHMRNDRGGWGGQPPQRQQPGAGGSWGAAPPSARGGAAGWDHESGAMNRRPDDGGTSYWGGRDKAPPGPPGSGGVSNWGDMPTPGPLPGPPARGNAAGMGQRMHPPNKDVWGAGPAHRPWGDGPDQPPPVGGGPSGGGGGAMGWGDAGGGEKPLGWGEGGWANNSRPRGMPRGSPGWEDGGGGGGDWGVKPKKGLTSDMIWGSKPFRILCDMGLNKADAESALRSTNLNLEDAIELLSSHGRLPLNRNDPPVGGGGGGNTLFPGNAGGGGGGDPYRSRQFPGQVPFAAAPDNGFKMPPNPPPSRHNQPSAQQLKLLVQQIQMAVQAGHLNPQILNQPLAPQALVLLNQLLQQIKSLQNYQHTMQNQKTLGTGNMSMLTVDITKTKQEIQNLQNQISAQQANYLKTQPLLNPPSSTSGGAGGGISDMLGVLSPNNNNAEASNGSRLNQWISKLPSDFTKAPGGGSKNNQDDPWGPTTPALSGWPESKESNTNGAIDSFGIPEFEPGKPWKGPGMKNPDEDPNLTPGSVAMAPIDLNPLSKAGSTTSLAAVTSSSSGNAELGLTWSFSKDAKDAKDTWSNNGPPAGPSASNLTAMGQDLWGKSAVGRTPPGLGSNSVTAAPTTTNNAWPNASNGWSSGGESGWLLLKNLSPQVDGTTLKALCMQHTQHGPLEAFNLFHNQGLALVHFSSGREAMKAQKALNGCPLNNTAIQAQSVSDQDADSFLQNAARSGGQTTPTRGATPSSIATSSSATSNIKTTASDMWGSSTTPVSQGSNSLFSNSNNTWGVPQDLLDQQRTTPQLQPFLPNDLLGENNL